jgi:hypothetical protein
MPHGGRRKGAGRKLGSFNKLTSEMKERAMTLGMEALERVGEVSEKPESDASLIRAAGLLLSHGFGRPAQADSMAQQTVKIERTYRWARNESEATLDPARPRAATRSLQRAKAKGARRKK